MRITLISPYDDFICYGVRGVAAFLKKQGHHVTTIFLYSGESRDQDSKALISNEAIMRDIIEKCRESELIGISLMTSQFNHAVMLTEKIKAEMDTPVIWGGIHPTIRPDECINYADIVCIGEGEIGLIELMRRMEEGKDYYDTKSMWFRKGGKIIKNPYGEKVDDLDGLPFADFSCEEQYTIRGGRLCKVDEALMKKYFTQVRGISLENRSKRRNIASKLLQSKTLREQQRSRMLPKYTTLTSRGCPYNCSFCSNSALRKIYGTKGYVRWRSIESIIDELSEVKKLMDYIGFINFQDDNFSARSLDEIRKFSKLYKEKIDLPFYCFVSPTTVTEEKIGLLVDAGLRAVKMGIQSGSPQTLKLFNRPMPGEKVKKAAAILNKYNPTIVPSYDVITDNPYEKLDNVLDTFHLLLELPKPYMVHSFSLTFLPGTDLYDRAKSDGIIKEEKAEIYNKVFERDKKRNYLNFVLALFTYDMPKIVYKILINRNIARFLSMDIFEPVFNMGHTLNRMVKGRK